MMDWDMARTTRSGTKVGPGIWRKGRPGMRPTSYPGSGGRGGRAILPAMTKAELMAVAGVRNLLITTEVVGPEKIGRLLKVLDKSPETLAVVDNAENIRELAAAMGRAG